MAHYQEIKLSTEPDQGMLELSNKDFNQVKHLKRFSWKDGLYVEQTSYSSKKLKTIFKKGQIEMLKKIEDK